MLRERFRRRVTRADPLRCARSEIAWTSLSLSLSLSLAPVVARVRGIAKGACPPFFRVLKLAATQR
jgi:hypothetical protein